MGLRSALSLAAVLATAALGCGNPSGLEICNASCDANKKCGRLTDAQTANCHSSCEANRGMLGDQDTADDKRCKNAGDVRRQALGCVNMECNKIDTCVQTLDNTCVAR